MRTRESEVQIPTATTRLVRKREPQVQQFVFQNPQPQLQSQNLTSTQTTRLVRTQEPEIQQIV